MRGHVSRVARTVTCEYRSQQLPANYVNMGGKSYITTHPHTKFFGSMMLKHRNILIPFPKGRFSYNTLKQNLAIS